MNKWVAIIIGVILVAGVGAFGFLYFQEAGDLKDAEAEIVTHLGTISGLETDLSASETEAADLSDKLSASESEVASLEGNVSTLEGEVSTLEGEVSDLTDQNSELDADLASANTKISGLQSSLSAAQSVNTSLTAELKTIKDPRHFESVTELSDWLQQDDTDTVYASLASGGLGNFMQMAFILQVRAARDGYILPAYILPGDGVTFVLNYAIIGDMMYFVDVTNDEVEAMVYLAGQPSHPEPLP